MALASLCVLFLLATKSNASPNTLCSGQNEQITEIERTLAELDAKFGETQKQLTIYEERLNNTETKLEQLANRVFKAEQDALKGARYAYIQDPFGIVDLLWGYLFVKK